MRQPSEDRALYYRELRRTLQTVFVPELTSAHAVDAAGLVDRILAEFIVEEEWAPALSEEFGAAFDALLRPRHDDDSGPTDFDEIRTEAMHVADRLAGSGDPRDRDLAGRLADVEHRFLERVDELRGDVLAERADEHAAEGCSITADQLTEYLRKRLPDDGDLAVDHLSVVPGGRSKETILVSLRGAHALPTELIVRKDRPVGVLQTRAADEYAVIDAVYQFGGVPVPQPFFAERDGHGLGDGTFLVMARVPGRKAGEFFPDLAAPAHHGVEIGLQIAAALARLHALPLDRLHGTHLDGHGSGVTEQAVTGAIDAITARIDELTGPPCVTVPLARRWLLDHVSDVAPASVVCLLQGDFGLHNMLVDRDRLTALVDWEGAAVGPPARELAAAWPAATALMPWPAFIDAYLDAGGPEEAADPRAIAYYRVFGSLGALMMSRTGGHLFRTGAKRDLSTAHSGLDSQFRCARNLARALEDATSSA